MYYLKTKNGVEQFDNLFLAFVAVSKLDEQFTLTNYQESDLDLTELKSKIKSKYKLKVFAEKIELDYTSLVSILNGKRAMSVDLRKKILENI